MYSQKWNCYFQNRIVMFCLPDSTLIYLWETFIFPGSVCLSAAGKYVDRSWDYINHSQTHECGNWDWGRAIPRKGIHKGDFLCSAYPRYVKIIYALLLWLWAVSLIYVHTSSQTHRGPSIYLRMTYIIYNIAIFQPGYLVRYVDDLLFHWIETQHLHGLVQVLQTATFEFSPYM